MSIDEPWESGLEWMEWMECVLNFPSFAITFRTLRGPSCGKGRHLWEAVRFIDVLVDHGAHPPAHTVLNLLTIAGHGELGITVSKMLNLPKMQIV